MSAVVFLLMVIALYCGYAFFGRFIRNVLGIDVQKQTPAVKNFDGVDYVPAKNWLILFGHHFASIAGAGPIVGPVFAYLYWGWLGVAFWIVLGSIFLGAVHDFASLFISVREGAVSIGQIARKYISKRASIVLLIFLWFALIIVIAVFADICAKSFVNEPSIVTPSLGLIPVAVLAGWLIYRTRVNILVSTLIGLAILAGLIFLGNRVPVQLAVNNPYFVWVIVLFIYSLFASVIPVNILLQPRDYISSFLLFFGIAVSAAGIFLRPLPIQSAKIFSFNTEIGPFFPLMFITVACGAISGFHSLVGSGTTSKQLATERDAWRIGYGAMILEGILAAVALICVAFGLKSIPQGKTPVEIFAQGFGNIVFFLGGYAKFIALVILNAFILTTLDTATRITRFISQELFGVKNKYVCSVLVVAAAAVLCLTGTFKNLWPMFGASNQLVAALTLLVISAYLLHNKRNFKVTIVPAAVMFLITISSLFIKGIDFFKQGNLLLATASLLLIVLGVFIIIEFIRRQKFYAA